MKINKDELKFSLSIENVESFIADLGGEPQNLSDHLTCKTICHCGNSHKLYYYDNTHLFKCYTECEGESFDIYSLTQRVKHNEGQDWSLPRAINYVASYFGYSAKEFDFEEQDEVLEDWDFIKNYEKINSIVEEQKVDLKIYNDEILNRLPHPRIEAWEKEGILNDVILDRGICYDPVAQGIVIPHYDVNGRLIGIRERTLIKEEEKYGKYKPAVICGKMYNHPLSFNLYNLNNSKDNIKIMKKAIVFEGEKSPLLFASMFGEESDITVACCGSSLIAYQVKLLLSFGVEEIIIAFDKQFQKIGDDEFKRWKRKLIDINKKYSSYATISFMFDKWDLLEYKDSPIDKGKDVFLELFERRIIL